MGKNLLKILGIAVLLLWGGTMLYFYATGRINSYLKGEFRTFALLAGLGLCVLAVFNLLTLRAEVECTHGHHDHDDDEDRDRDHDHDHDHDHEDGGDCCHGHGHDDHEDGHDHDHATPSLGFVSLLILVVPLLAAAGFSQDRYSDRVIRNKGLYAIVDATKASVGKSEALATPGARERSDASGAAPADAPAAGDAASGEATPDAEEEEEAWGEYTLADLEAQVDKSEAGNYLLTVPQLFYTAGDEELQRVITGLPVETIAQVMPEKLNNEEGKRLRIFRLFIECCAADARPLSIPIEFAEAVPDYQEMGWVKVVGKMTYVEEGEIIVPLLQIDSMEETEAPEDAFMF